MRRSRQKADNVKYKSMILGTGQVSEFVDVAEQRARLHERGLASLAAEVA